MAHFVAHFTWNSPPDPALAEAEGENTRQRLARGDMLRQLFLATDVSCGWGIWRAESAEQVLQELESLPLRKFMDITVTEVTVLPAPDLASPFATAAPES